MRRCPECYEIYENGERFCELDGQPLLADPALHPAVEESPSPAQPATNTQQSWLTGLLGLTVGILLCGAAYTVYTLWTAGASEEQKPSHSARTQPAVQPERPAPPQRPAEVAENEEESKDAEEEASPEPQPEPTAAETVSARLNQGPVSTGPRVKESDKAGTRVQTVILMKDGTSVEVDAAWEDKQGVWYRRGALVSFVESQLVKSITARAEPKLTSDGTAP